MRIRQHLSSKQQGDKFENAFINTLRAHRINHIQLPKFGAIRTRNKIIGTRIVCDFLIAHKDYGVRLLDVKSKNGVLTYSDIFSNKSTANQINQMSNLEYDFKDSVSGLVVYFIDKPSVCFLKTKDILNLKPRGSFNSTNSSFVLNPSGFSFNPISIFKGLN